MRWLIFFLFVLNGLIFVWFSFQKDQKVQLIESERQEEFDFSGVNKVVLLSEVQEFDLLGRDIRRNNRVGQSAQTGGEGSGTDASICALVGPFLEVISAKQARGRLQEKGLSSRTVLVLKELPAVNWVYIAPQSDRKKALALLRDLQAKNIDSFLIADGEYENGISLGFFTSRESAEAVLAERAEQGYPVSLAEKKRDQKTYWLAFDERSSSQLDDGKLGGLQEGNFAVKKQEKSCTEVALLKIIE